VRDSRPERMFGVHTSMMLGHDCDGEKHHLYPIATMSLLKRNDVVHILGW
jgi:hypothetical protein